MVITPERILLAVGALGLFFYLQRRGGRRAEEDLKKLQERQQSDELPDDTSREG